MNKKAFLTLFVENTEKRSRTSTGVGDTSVSVAKKGLLKTGEDLKRQVRENTMALAKNIWETPRARLEASLVRSFLESWFDIIHADILDRGAHASEQSQWGKHSVTMMYGLLCRVNNKYRFWEVKYAYPEESPPPEYLEIWMDAFYAELVKKMTQTNGKSVNSVAKLLAWADREMDFIIHPWSDGCGRLSTALVMWLALRVSEVGLPKFGTREEHYRAMKITTRHTEYFLKCLKP